MPYVNQLEGMANKKLVFRIALIRTYVIISLSNRQSTLRLTFAGGIEDQSTTHRYLLCKRQEQRAKFRLRFFFAHLQLIKYYCNPSPHLVNPPRKAPCRSGIGTVESR